MTELKRFYEKLTTLGFEISDSMKADYVLALNRNGEPNKAIYVALEALDRSFIPSTLLKSKLQFVPQLEIASELMIGIATAEKNKFLVAQKLLTELKKGPESWDLRNLRGLMEQYQKYFLVNNSDDITIEKIEKNIAKSLDESNKFYTSAFEITKSYYPGINLVRNLIYKNQSEKAFQLAKLVKQTAYLADTEKSFWPIATLLETGLVMNDVSEVEKRLPQVLDLLLKQEKSDIESLLEHLKLWKELKTERNEGGITLLDGVISQIEKVSTTGKYEPEKTVCDDKYCTVNQTVNDTTFAIGISRRGDSYMPNNARWGGLVVDNPATLADKELRQQLIENGLLLTEEGPKSLIGIENIDEADRYVDKYIESAYRLRHPETGLRDIENMDEVRHIELEAFWWGLMDLVGSTDSKMSASSMMSMLAVGMGDCRHTNGDKQYLLSGWLESKQHPLIDKAFVAWQDGDYARFDSTISEIDNWNRYDYVQMSVQTFGNIQSDGPYKIKREDGMALLSDKEEFLDKHTFTIRIEYDENHDVVRLVTKDAWYGNEDLFQLNGRVIEGEDLENFRKTGYLIIKDGAKVRNESGDTVYIPIKLVPESYSKARQNITRRYDVLDLILGAQAVDKPPIELFTDPKRRQEFYENFIKPVIINGLEVMIRKGGEDKPRAENYLKLLAA